MSEGARLIASATLVTLLLAAGLVAPAAAAAGVPGKDGGRTGFLIVDHGEPPEYNEFTYWSFRKFFDHLMEMGLIPSWLKLLDTGTIVVDRSCYGCEVSPSPKLMDAWLHPHEGPAAYVPASDSLPAHYVLPGGPGLGEPDIFEHVGLSAWDEWESMGGRSPNYGQKLTKKKFVLRRLAAEFGDSLPIEIGYGIDPRLNGGTQGLRKAISRLVNTHRVDHVVVAYHGVGFSDVMQTHMIRHELQLLLEELGSEATLSYAQPIGTSDHYLESIVRKVKDEIAELPARAPVAIHLSGHGLPTGMCGDYDCGADSYHESSRALFKRTKAAIERAVDRPGKFGVFHLYGEGAAEEDDPDDLMDSPIEALNKRVESGFRYVVDIPYEFDSDSRDTLIILRRGYERPIPDWDHRYESRFRYEKMNVKITNASFGGALKARAFQEVIFKALRQAGL